MLRSWYQTYLFDKFADLACDLVVDVLSYPCVHFLALEEDLQQRTYLVLLGVEDLKELTNVKSIDTVTNLMYHDFVLNQ
jgi:hypothetical protein